MTRPISFGRQVHANLSQANLANADFSSATLTGADFTGADVRGASFRRTRDTYAGNPILFGTGITLAQLYSTASYQAHDLYGVDFSFNELDRGYFAGQNFANANFSDATLTDANLSGAILTGANVQGATSTAPN